MTAPQVISLTVLIFVIAALIWNKVRSDIVALSGAAVLLATGVVRATEVQGAFASPAIIALASLFVIAYAMELSGMLGWIIRRATDMCAHLGAAGLWIFIAFSGAVSAFLNNTPLIVLAGPVVRDVAESLHLSPRKFLIPLSYATILGGACTLIGTSTNLLVNDMAQNAGQPAFRLFDITPVALVVALAGALYLFFFGDRMLSHEKGAEVDVSADNEAMRPATAFNEPSSITRPLQVIPAILALGVFLSVVTIAALGYASIAAAAFSGAVLLVLLRAISIDDAYKGLRPEILLLIAGMVVVGLSLEVTGLAALATKSLVESVGGLGPATALAVLYAITLVLTEILSNAAVAVLLTPVAVALAESLGVSPRPYLIAIMMAASAAFATPFGYQTNVLVYQLGGYSYLDFVKIGIPLNLLTWVVGVFAILSLVPF